MKPRPSHPFGSLFAPAAARRLGAAWQPAADVYRCEEGWLLKFDLAGVRPEDVEVQLTTSSVTVSGTRRDWRVYDRQESHLMEIAYSRFERSVELPEEIQAAEMRTEFRHGMLLVHILLHEHGSGDDETTP